jgi:hypothetical protein
MYSLLYIIIRFPYSFLTMTTIFIEKRTREKLRNIGHKDQTYDDIINELIRIKEESKLSSNDLMESIA